MSDLAVAAFLALRMQLYEADGRGLSDTLCKHHGPPQRRSGLEGKSVGKENRELLANRRPIMNWVRPLAFQAFDDHEQRL